MCVQGMFSVLPTPRGIQGMERWAEGAQAALPEDVEETVTDQVRHPSPT